MLMICCYLEYDIKQSCKFWRNWDPLLTIWLAGLDILETDDT